MFAKLRPHLFSLLIIFLSSLTPLVWFKKNLLLYTIDFNFPLKPLNDIASMVSVWDVMKAPGAQSLGNLANFPFKFFIFSLTRVFSLVVTEKIYFVLYFALFGISAYFLIITILDNKYRRVAAVAGALVYMFNPYTLNLLWHNLTLNHLYAVLPAIIALLYRIFEKRYRSRWNFILLAVLTIIASASNINPAYTFVAFFSTAFFVLFYALIKENRKRFIKIISTYVMLLIFMIFLHSWWIVPYAKSLSNQYTHAKDVISKLNLDNNLILKQNSQHSIFANNFRMAGYWQLYEGHGLEKTPYYSYAQFYKSKKFIILSLIFPFLAFGAFFFRRKSKNGSLLLFFASLGLISIFLLKGVNPPLRSFFGIAMNKFSFLGMFRNFYDKFGILLVLSYSMMSAFAIQSLVRVYDENRGIINRGLILSIPMFLVPIIIFSNSPFWSNDFFESKATPSAYVEVPNYYSDAAKWFNTQKGNFYTLPIPFPRIYYAAFDWEKAGYWGSYPSNWYFNKPFINSYTGDSYDLYEDSAKQLIENNVDNRKLGKILTALNVKYLIYYKDSDWDFVKGNRLWVSADPDKLENILAKQSWLKKDKQFGNLIFYRNLSYKNRFIYASNQVRKGQLNSSTKVSSQSIYVSDDRKFNLGDTEPQLKILSVSPTSYRITAQSKGPFFLVFSQSFDKLWKAYDKGQNKELAHIKVNNSFNGYYVEKGGEHTILLHYELQNYFIFGFVVTILSVIIMLIVLFNDKLYSRFSDN